MTDWREESHKSYFLALSLLVHLALLIVLLKITDTDRMLFEKIIPTQHTLEKQDEHFDMYTPAALKSRASNFGAPVHFHEEPEMQGNDSDGPAEQTQDGMDTQQPEQAVQTLPMPTIQQKQDALTQPAQEQPMPEEPKKAEATPELHEVKLHQSTVIIEKNTGKQEPEKAKPKIEEKEPAKEPEKKEPPQPKPAQKQAQQKPVQNVVRKKIAQRSLGDDLRSAAPIKKQLTLADLAEGFINTLNRGGNDWLDRDGDDKKRPDFEDLKYLSYTKKVVWYMQNEWRATQDKLGIQLHQEYILSLIITFLKDGSIGDVRVIHPSGSPQLDEFLIRGIRNAGPYPPIPTHFKSDSFDLPLNIVNARERSQPWQMYLSRSR
jgi:outer membrane biosynthesis protein TonB